MDKGQVNIILPSKDGSHFCTASSVREKWARSSEPPFSDQDQGHDMTLNIVLPDTPPE